MLNYGFQSRIDICGSVMAIIPKDLWGRLAHYHDILFH